MIPIQIVSAKTLPIFLKFNLSMGETNSFCFLGHSNTFKVIHPKKIAISNVTPIDHSLHTLFRQFPLNYICNQISNKLNILGNRFIQIQFIYLTNLYLFIKKHTNKSPNTWSYKFILIKK